MQQKLKVLFIASEVAPFAKVGGLADVVGSLPKKLYELGIDARIICPRYESVRLKELEAQNITNIQVPFGGTVYTVRVYQAYVPGSKVLTYLLDEPSFLSTGPIYRSGPEWRNELTKRFLFFSLACLLMIKKLRLAPNLIHTHDWPTAPVCLLIKNIKMGRRHGIKTLTTIHNINNKNYASNETLLLVGLDAQTLSPLTRSSSNPRYFNLFAQSLLDSDTVNTVSPTYAKEILHPPFDGGLEKILRRQKKPIVGILNGIDTEYFDPATDQYLAERFDPKTLFRRAINKLALQKALGLRQSNRLFLCGMVTRLSEQKGIELVLVAMERLLPSGHFQFALLGEGEKKYESKLRLLQKKHPRAVSFTARYDSHLAKQIYGGSDTFLMPSLFEPCGLAQLVAMRYGSLPIVHDTGGLHDTIIDYRRKGGYGFTFKNFSAPSFLHAIQAAFKIFQFPLIWKKMQVNAMKADFSWNRSAQAYLQLYKKIIKT